MVGHAGWLNELGRQVERWEAWHGWQQAPSRCRQLADSNAVARSTDDLKVQQLERLQVTTAAPLGAAVATQKLIIPGAAY
jgi:hypothetical protein